MGAMHRLMENVTKQTTNASIAQQAARSDVDTVNVGGEIRGTAGGLKRAQAQQDMASKLRLGSPGGGSIGAKLLGS